MARALIVGCGCRGRALGCGLLDQGWVVRGTSRTAAGVEAIEAAGIDGALADPDRPGTVLDLVGDVALVYWLMGSAQGADADLSAIHGPRLQGLLERLVDTPVRGFVYEGAGTAAPGHLLAGSEAVNRASATWRIPARVVEEPPASPPDAWLTAMLAARADLVG